MADHDPGALDHSRILDKMAQQEKVLMEVLGECRSIRQDMKDDVQQSKEEARKDREQARREVGELHERINEISKVCHETKTRQESTNVELEKVRTNLGRVTLGLVCSVISAVIVMLTTSGG